jgi:hypothetical protein
MLSSFGGTIALGVNFVDIIVWDAIKFNVAASLVLTLNKTLANEQDFIEPKIDIIEPSDAVMI